MGSLQTTFNILHFKSPFGRLKTEKVKVCIG